MTRRLVAAAAVALLAAAPVTGLGAERLFRILRDGKWGYVDAAGNVAIPPRFDGAEPFSEGLASVRLGARLGYVDSSGAFVLLPAFEPAGVLHRPFVDGLAVVRAGGRYGYMDHAGRLAIAARFAAAEDFSGGLALTCSQGAGCGWVDRAGRGAIGPGYMGGQPARDGMVCATTQMAMGRVRVVLVRADGTRLPGEYEGCGAFSEGLVAVRTPAGWGWLDGAGRGAISPRFEWAGDFGSGLAPAREPGGLCGYVGRDGAWRIPPRFRSCASFAGGRARVDLARSESDRERWAFLDPGGKVAIDGETLRPGFDSAEDFKDGLAAVGSGGQPGLAGTGPLLGYVDPSGRWIWPPTR